MEDDGWQQAGRKDIELCSCSTKIVITVIGGSTVSPSTDMYLIHTLRNIQIRFTSALL